MEFVIGMVVGASIFSTVVALSMAKAAKEIDETETAIFKKEVEKHGISEVPSGWTTALSFCKLKNIITCIGTIVAMAFIMFCGVLFSTLLVKMVNFVSGIVTEISYRL